MIVTSLPSNWADLREGPGCVTEPHTLPQLSARHFASHWLESGDHSLKLPSRRGPLQHPRGNSVLFPPPPLTFFSKKKKALTSKGGIVRGKMSYQGKKNIPKITVSKRVINASLAARTLIQKSLRCSVFFLFLLTQRDMNEAPGDTRGSSFFFFFSLHWPDWKSPEEIEIRTMKRHDWLP